MAGKKTVKKAEPEFVYMVNSYTGTLIRLGNCGVAEFFTLGGWVSSPRLNDIRYGLGPFMEYDDITEEKAMELIRKEKERAEARKREHENDSKDSSEGDGPEA